MSVIQKHLGNGAETAELRESFRQLAVAQSDVRKRFHAACGVQGSDLPLVMLDTLQDLGHTDAMTWLHYENGRNFSQDRYAHPALDRYIGHGTAEQVQGFIDRMPAVLQREVMGHDHFLRQPHIDYSRGFELNPHAGVATVVMKAYEAAGLGDLREHDRTYTHMHTNGQFSLAGLSVSHGNLVRVQELKELGFAFSPTQDDHPNCRPAWAQGVANYNYWANRYPEWHPEEELTRVRQAINFACVEAGREPLFENPALPHAEQPVFTYNERTRIVT